MRRLSLLVGLLTLTVFVSVSLAQQTKPTQAPTPVEPAKPAEPAPVKLEKFNGVIAKVDEATKSLVVKTKKEEKTFVTDEQTKITKGKESLTFSDLKPGMNVSVEYKKEGDKLIASAIKVAVPKAAPKK